MKKKPSEIFEGVNSTLHQSFVEAVERDKNKPNNLPSDVRNKVVKPNKTKELDRATKISIGELNKTKLVDEITAKELTKTKEPKSWQIDKGAQEAEDKAAKNFYDKAVKPKELDWEKVAFLFHNTYEGLAPKFGYETRKDTKAFDTKSQNGQLMIATCKAVVSHFLTQQRTELLEQILNLECLKEEEFDESDDVIDEEVREKRNQLRKEIIDEINTL